MIYLNEVVETLFALGSDRALTVAEVVDKISEKFNTNLPTEQANSIVRKYRSSGSGLESAAQELLSLCDKGSKCSSKGGCKDDCGSGCRLEINHENRLALEAQYKDKFGDYNTEMVDIAITLVESFGYASSDLNLDNADIEDTPDCSGYGLYIKEHGKIYRLGYMEDLRSSAVESIAEYICQNPDEVARYGVQGVNDMDLESLLFNACYSEFDLAELNKDETVFLIRYESIVALNEES
jgi:hypothetical protein